MFAARAGGLDPEYMQAQGGDPEPQPVAPSGFLLVQIPCQSGRPTQSPHRLRCSSTINQNTRR